MESISIAVVAVLDLFWYMDPSRVTIDVVSFLTVASWPSNDQVSPKLVPLPGKSGRIAVKNSVSVPVSDLVARS